MGAKISNEYKAGVRARIAREPSTSNPYVEDDWDWIDWVDGWEDAQRFQFISSEIERARTDPVVQGKLGLPEIT